MSRPSTTATATSDVSHDIGGRLAQRDERLRRIAAMFYVVATVVAVVVTNSRLGAGWSRLVINSMIPIAIASIAMVWWIPWNRLPHYSFAFINVSSLALTAILVNETGGWSSPFVICSFFATIFCALYYQRRLALALALASTAVSASPALTFGMPPGDQGGVEGLVRLVVVSAMVHIAIVVVGQALTNEVEKLHAEATKRVIERDHEIEQRRLLEEQLAYQAHHDPLTRLPNRALLLKRMELALGDIRSGGTAVLLLDLDGFKQVNDTYGHGVGDQLLIAVGERVQRLMRHSDTPARLGGDEFTVVLPNLESLDAAQAIAERIGAAIAQPFVFAEGVATVSASVGLAWLPAGGAELLPDNVLRAADVALYQAKGDGKHCVRVAPALVA